MGVRLSLERTVLRTLTSVHAPLPRAADRYVECSSSSTRMGVRRIARVRCHRSYSTALLYTFFCLGAFAAPAAVARAGAKRCMVGAMCAYSLYVFAYASPTLPTLLIGGAVGGAAGALLWVAQGVQRLTPLAVAVAYKCKMIMMPALCV